jgi:hypothetical protein
MQKHVMTCPEYIQLYKDNPAAALDPEKEYVRWKLEDDNEDAKEARKAVRRQGFRDQDNARLAAQQDRWKATSKSTPADPVPVE